MYKMLFELGGESIRLECAKPRLGNVPRAMYMTMCGLMMVVIIGNEMTRFDIKLVDKGNVSIVILFSVMFITMISNIIVNLLYSAYLKFLVISEIDINKRCIRVKKFTGTRYIPLQNMLLTSLIDSSEFDTEYYSDCHKIIVGVDNEFEEYTEEIYVKDKDIVNKLKSVGIKVIGK